MITKIAFVAQPTTDMGSMKRFYGELLGLESSFEHPDVWSEYRTPDGKTIALDTFTPKNAPSPSVYVALETDDIDAEIARLKEAGVTIVLDTMANQGEDGREVCRMAMVLDPDSNPVMLHETAAWRVSGDPA